MPPINQLGGEVFQEALDAYEEYGTERKAAKALQLSRGAFSNRLRKARKWQEKQGLHLPEGMRESMKVAMLDGMTIDGGWIMTDEEGNVVKRSTRYSQKPEVFSQEILGKIAAAFEEIPAAPAIVQSEHSIEGKIAFFPQSDVHLGVEITPERGGQTYSPEIAMERMRDGFAQAHAAIPPCETAIILDNGDLTHANDDRDMTPRSGHILKVTGSHRQNLDLSVTAKAWQIDMALQRSARVVYRSNRGNHDPNTPDTVGIALKQRYRDEPRVMIDDSERETWIYQRGKIFIAAHHGHGLKAEKLAANIPPNFPEEFGRSRFWYLFTGHMHHPRQDNFGAFIWYQLPSMCSMDQHSADLGYTDTSAQRAMMFCENAGLKHDMTIRF